MSNSNNLLPASQSPSLTQSSSNNKNDDLVATTKAKQISIASSSTSSSPIPPRANSASTPPVVSSSSSMSAKLDSSVDNDLQNKKKKKRFSFTGLSSSSSSPDGIKRKLSSSSSLKNGSVGSNKSTKSISSTSFRLNPFSSCTSAPPTMNGTDDDNEDYENRSMPENIERPSTVMEVVNQAEKLKKELEVKESMLIQSIKDSIDRTKMDLNNKMSLLSKLHRYQLESDLYNTSTFFFATVLLVVMVLFDVLVYFVADGMNKDIKLGSSITISGNNKYWITFIQAFQLISFVSFVNYRYFVSQSIFNSKALMKRIRASE